MAWDADALVVYGDTNRIEDVVRNAIRILTAKENFLLNRLGETTAKDLTHIYQVDTLRTASSAAVALDGDYDAIARTTPSRVNNIVQMVAIPFQVVRAQNEVQHYSGTNELERQTQKSIMDWANAAEFDLLRSTLVSGVSGTAPKMSGIIQACSRGTNHTTHNSGTTFHTSILDGLMRGCVSNSNGDGPNELLLSAFTRQKMDEATQKSNVVVNTPGIMEIVRTVSTYTTAFGTLNVRYHRYITVSGTDATDRIMAINSNLLKIAYLKKPYVDKDLARLGDYDYFAVTGKLTLETHDYNPHFFADGFLLS